MLGLFEFVSLLCSFFVFVCLGFVGGCFVACFFVLQFNVVFLLFLLFLLFLACVDFIIIFCFIVVVFCLLLFYSMFVLCFVGLFLVFFSFVVMFLVLLFFNPYKQYIYKRLVIIKLPIS